MNSAQITARFLFAPSSLRSSLAFSPQPVIRKRCSPGMRYSSPIGGVGLENCLHFSILYTMTIRSRVHMSAAASIGGLIVGTLAGASIGA